MGWKSEILTQVESNQEEWEEKRRPIGRKIQDEWARDRNSRAELGRQITRERDWERADAEKPQEAPEDVKLNRINHLQRREIEIIRFSNEKNGTTHGQEGQTWLEDQREKK